MLYPTMLDDVGPTMLASFEQASTMKIWVKHVITRVACTAVFLCFSKVETYCAKLCILYIFSKTLILIYQNNYNYVHLKCPPRCLSKAL